jgi:dihydroxyacetone kinase-like protein
LNIYQAKKFIVCCSDAFEKKLGYLSELDAALGDGDHGTSMLGGFRAAKEIIESREYSDVGSVWLDAGKVIMSKTGGTCGPLFSAFFIKGGMPAKGKTEADLELLSKMVTAGCDGVMSLGKAVPGEKTMVDALKPAADALKAASEAGCDTAAALKQCLDAARAGAESTAGMLALKGRGRYQGENARNHIDPGAVSVTVIIEQIYNTMNQ